LLIGQLGNSEILALSTLIRHRLWLAKVREAEDATIKCGVSRHNDLQSTNKPCPPKEQTALKPSSTANILNPPTTEPAKGSNINPVIYNVRRSKEVSIQQKILSAAQTREQRRLERREAEALNTEIKRSRLEVLKLRKQLSDRLARAKTERENRAKQEQRAKVENEIQFELRVHVEHQATVKEMEDARHRMSINDRAKLCQNHREGKRG
jgi:hypothetical protein